MNKILLLMRANIFERKARTMLTALATACSVCLIMWIVSGYASAVTSLDLYASRALGRYVLVVDPVSRKADREVLPEALELLRAQPEVAHADPMWAELVSFSSGKERGGGPGFSRAVIQTGIEEVAIGTDANDPPFKMARGTWIGADKTDALEVVLNEEFARELGVEIGDSIHVPGPTDRRPNLTVVGIIESPPDTPSGTRVGSRMLPSPSVGAAFLSMRDAQSMHRAEPTITFVALVVHPEADVHAFRYRLNPILNALPQPVQFMTDIDLEEEMSEAAQASHIGIQAYVVGAVAALLSFLVIFSTLSMGVSERTRQFALLRATVLSKGQLAVLVIGEGMVLACLGLLIGIPLGWAVISGFDSATTAMLRHGASVQWTGVALAIIIAFFATLVAGLLPAYRATRVQPLDAIAPPAETAARFRLWWLLVALPLLAVLPMFSFLFPPGISDPVLGRLLLGAACLLGGLFLLTPVLIHAADFLFAPVIARVLGLPTSLLKQQLTTHVWRSVAAALTLSIGMGLFASIHVWGNSMVQVFVPGTWAPDVTLVFKQALTPEAVHEMKSMPGVAGGRCEPLMVEQPRMRDDVLNSAEFPSVTRQNVIVLAGINPAGAFGGANPFIETRWLAGTPEAAIAMMKNERGLVVPDHFLEQSGLHVGDDLFLVPPENPQHPICYKIAGAIELIGGQWMTKTTNMRMRTHRASGLVFADYNRVAEDFNLPGPRHLWVHTADGTVDRKALESDAQARYETAAVELSDEMRASEMLVMPTTTITKTILGAASFWLWVMSVVPLIAVAISCIALVNLFLSSIRARQWEFGILRSVGFTRSTLVRLVIAEGILIGMVACVLGCGFGIIAGWCGTALSQVASWFGGMSIILAVPLAALSIGSLVLLFFAALAAAWPALRVGCTSPMKLLSQGRGQE